MEASLQSGAINELRINAAMINLYHSPGLRGVMQDKGFPDMDQAMSQLKSDIGEDGVLANPQRWGLDKTKIQEHGEADQTADVKVGRNRGTVQEESRLWEAVKANAFKVPLEHGTKELSEAEIAVMGRWQRVLQDCPMTKAEYAAIEKGPGINKRKARFREKWAKGEYDQLMERALTSRIPPSRSRPLPRSM